MLIKRTLLHRIQKELKKEPKIIILYGPRQAGKTTLINQLLQNYKENYLFLNGDDIRTQELLNVPNLDTLKKMAGNNRLLVIDEAQRIANIGLSLKLLYDNSKLRIIASGSSSLDLSNKINEPLTGRSTLFTLYPLSLMEIPVIVPDISITSRLEEFLRFGLYPKTVTLIGEEDKKNYLNDLVNNYLYKDILTFETVRKPKKVIDLLTLLALQIGSEVSILELAQNLALSKTIVEKYLDLLEKMFIIVNLRGFSRNLRKEISKTSKYYFVDLGLRNALIRNFNPLSLRNDKGSCFENLCIVERIKKLANNRKTANLYFWRTYDQKEIDLIEESDGNLKAFEFKLSGAMQKSNKAFSEFSSVYANSEFKSISSSNIEEFLQE